jgi:hypothetical protein
MINPVRLFSRHKLHGTTVAGGCKAFDDRQKYSDYASDFLEISRFYVIHKINHMYFKDTCNIYSRHFPLRLILSKMHPKAYLGL